LKDHQKPPDELQEIDRTLDLDQLLLEFAAQAFSKIGAPARHVGKLLRALLLLDIKNARSGEYLEDTELKHNCNESSLVRELFALYLRETC
jgi:hypothetical protein